MEETQRPSMPSSITNQEIAKIFKEIAIFLEMDTVPFKPKAYDNAARVIAELQEELSTLYQREGKQALLNIPSIGEALAKKIETLLSTGKLPYYERLKEKYPIDVLSLEAIEGIGTKMIFTLYKELKVKNLDDLEQALQRHAVHSLPGFGEKTEKKLNKAIKFFKQTSHRFILGFIMPEIEKFVCALKQVPGVKRLEVAGSVRRMTETIGDLDLVAVATEPKRLIDTFISLPQVADVVVHGDEKALVRLKNGMDVDLLVLPYHCFGAALLHFTGSRAHNIALRNIALSMDYTLNEHGLFTNHLQQTKKRRLVAAKTEEEIYQALHLQYIPPEMRENQGEIEMAQKKNIPKLINYGDLKGDLQVQTDWSDGNASIEAMAIAAKAYGLDYIAITDHTKSLTIARGNDERRLAKQIKEIDRLNKKFKGTFRILKSAEVDILKDGSLDLKNDILKKLDLVGVSIHSHFRMPKAEMTKRICRALAHPLVDIFFHPTGRLLQQRDAYAVDMDEVIQTASRTGTVLEINAFPQRLDLSDVSIQRARRSKVHFTVDSDAHSPAHFPYLCFGIGQARRGWLQKRDVINTLPVHKMLKLIKRNKQNALDG